LRQYVFQPPDARPLSVIIATPAAVSEACAPAPGQLDDLGNPYAASEVVCCYRRDTNTVWARETAPECLMHELCHWAYPGHDAMCGRTFIWWAP
jgi:hypothetical protein